MNTPFQTAARRPTFRAVSFLAKSAFCTVGLVLILFVYHKLATEHTQIPWEYMWFGFEDEGGVATIRSTAFVVGFEGASWPGNHSGGSYLVDGRYPFGGNTAPVTMEIKETGLVYEYAARKRLVTFRYQGHTIAYSSRLKTLSVDGHEFSTAEGQLQLLVKRNGQIGRSLPSLPASVLENRRHGNMRQRSSDAHHSPFAGRG